MTRVWTRVAAGVALVVIVTGAASCATRTTPAVAPSAVVRTPPAVPRDLATRTADVAAYEQAWARMRSGSSSPSMGNPRAAQMKAWASVADHAVLASSRQRIPAGRLLLNI